MSPAPSIVPGGSPLDPSRPRAERRGWGSPLPGAVRWAWALTIGLAACQNDQGFVTRPIEDVAVTTGDFDDIAEPLDRMLIDYTPYEGIISTATWSEDYDPDAVVLKVEKLLEDEDEIDRYDAVFVASGTRGLGKRQYNGVEPDDSLVGEVSTLLNVARFVSEGGVLVASDWAYDLVEAIWPDGVEWVGDDVREDDAQVGVMDLVQAQVSDARLEASLGTDTVAIRFDYSNWAVMTDAHPQADVWLRGTVRYVDEEGAEVTLEDAPLAVSFSPADGSGTVLLTAFHLGVQTPAVVDALLLTAIDGLRDGRTDE